MASTTGWTRLSDENDIDNILTRIGATTESGGTTSSGSVMAKLNTIIANGTTGNTDVSAIKSDVTNIINNLLGGTSETGGTASSGSAMAKLNAIINYVDGVEANTNTNNIADKNGVLSQKLAFLIETLLTGDVGQKLDDLIAKPAGDITGKTMYFEEISVSDSNNSYALVKNYSNNKGGFVRIVIRNPTSRIKKLKLEVDGVVVANDAHWAVLMGAGYSENDPITSLDVPFDSSFKIYSIGAATTFGLLYYINK